MGGRLSRRRSKSRRVVGELEGGGVGRMRVVSGCGGEGGRRGGTLRVSGERVRRFG